MNKILSTNELTLTCIADNGVDGEVLRKEIKVFISGKNDNK